MAKILKDTEMLEIITKTVKENLIDDGGQYCNFLEELAGVVADHFGAEAGDAGIEDGEYYIAFHPTECLPDGGGVFKDYDKDVEW